MAAGRGFIVAEDECLANTRKGKQVLNVDLPDETRAMTTVDGELVASLGENRKMLVFPLDQVPEMTRGRGVRLGSIRESITVLALNPLGNAVHILGSNVVSGDELGQYAEGHELKADEQERD